MRVLVVHNRYRSDRPSGENAVVDDEAHLLEQFGCRVERLEVSSDDIAGWPLYRRAMVPAGVTWSRRGKSLTADAIRRFRPEVVHFHNTFPLLSPAALWAARSSGVPVVHTLHNFRPLCAAATFFRDGHVCEECLGRRPLPALRYGCYRGSRAATAPVVGMEILHSVLDTWRRCVDVFVLPSEFARAKYVQAGWPAARLVVKYNTVPDVERRPRHRAAGFACLSRLGREKGVDLLLEAWGRAFPDGAETLRVIGSGDDEDALRRAARPLAGVEIAGRLTHAEALSVVAGARALVVPSRSYEVFPRVVVEAYALGVAVVAARLGGLAEVVEDGHTGLLFDPGSPESLRHALRRVATSPTVSTALGANARRAYEQRFSPRRTTARLLAIYRAAESARRVA
jgi:glycosyltransferase involved in cell wall biosynthesis